jgi:hypothetical protein
MYGVLQYHLNFSEKNKEMLKYITYLSHQLGLRSHVKESETFVHAVHWIMPLYLLHQFLFVLQPRPGIKIIHDNYQYFHNIYVPYYPIFLTLGEKETTILFIRVPPLATLNQVTNFYELICEGYLKLIVFNFLQSAITI